jgi:hypothetical protein
VTVLSLSALLTGAALVSARDADAAARAAAAAHASGRAPPPAPTHRLLRWAVPRVLSGRFALARAMLSLRLLRRPAAKRDTALTLLRQAHKAAAARALGAKRTGTGAAANGRRRASGGD